ncbi:hypothetical protein PBCVAP110A_933L [Paramecium bursaria Chlorella virus AP110A]|nr:hypothetical protein PBCVAP110A_933L [Paramecium bursaria Chlorella virus AP110A]
MDLKSRELLKEKRKRDLQQQQITARGRAFQSRRDSRPMPMMLDARARTAVPRRVPETRLQKPAARPVGIKKVVRETVKNNKGGVYAITKKSTIQTRASSCSKVYTPKQEGAICWFAAVFTTLFYSQNMRIVVKAHAQRLVRDPSSREISLAMLEVLKGYETGKVSSRVVNHMQPRQFLMDLRKARPDYFSAMQNGTDEAHYAPYQHSILAFLKVPHLSIGVVNGKLLYSGFNVDLPLDSNLWARSMQTMGIRGVFIDTNKPAVLMFHRDSGEDYVQTLIKVPTPSLGSVAGYNPNAHAPVIKYNGVMYILDSCIIGAELRTQACSIAHAIAGVTCNGERYVYNGWTAKSADPAMAGSSSVIRDMPCALGKYPWDQNKSFCINTGACRFQNSRPNQIGRELCFNAVARSSVTYIRADIAKKGGVRKVARLIKR